MAYTDIHQLLDALELRGELHRVKVEVDPLQEVAEITDRVSKSAGGKALLFEQVKGSRLPVVTNLFGSIRRICLALEVAEPLELTRRMEGLLAGRVPQSLDNALFDEFQPYGVDSAPCRQLVNENPDLGELPALKSWPGDGSPSGGGKFFTLPLVFSNDPDTGEANCGMYRVELFGPRSCGIHWYAGSGGSLHCGRYAVQGRRMPVAIALGSDPAVILSAAMPLPGSLDEMRFAGFLRREPVAMVRCRTSDLMVPANAEAVIEGYIEPGDTCRGGAFGNHTGFSVPGGDLSVVRITCITRRCDAVIPATVVGQPPMEDCFMAKAIERLMLPVVRMVLPEVVEMSFIVEGIFHGAAVVSIAKDHPGHARQVVESLWSQGWLARSRLLVIVDSDVDPHDLSLAAWRVFNNVDWQRDVMIAPTVAGRPAGAFGGRLGIDATRKSRAETGRDWPQELHRNEAVRLQVSSRWSDYGF